MMIGVVGISGFCSRSTSKSRSSMTTSPETWLTPDFLTSAAIWSSPARGFSGVRVAPGMALASAWSRLVKSTV